MALEDVRDLALAVVEGAVAAESLAKELKRTPDRSRHFQDIADRLRAIVERPSIRRALSSPGDPPVVSPPQAPVIPPPLPSSVRGGVPPQLRSVEVHPDFEARLEVRLQQLEGALTRALARRDDGERYALRSPEEALALAARLVERLRRDPRLIVRIEPNG